MPSTWSWIECGCLGVVLARLPVVRNCRNGRKVTQSLGRLLATRQSLLVLGDRLQKRLGLLVFTGLQQFQRPRIARFERSPVADRTDGLGNARATSGADVPALSIAPKFATRAVDSCKVLPPLIVEINSHAEVSAIGKVRTATTRRALSHANLMPS